MEIEGRLLNFEATDGFGCRISKDCKIDIPDVVPIIDKTNMSGPNAVIGHASVSRDENGLSTSGTILDESLPFLFGSNAIQLVTEGKITR